MSTIRSIATRFTLTGLAATRTVMRRIVDVISDGSRRAGTAFGGFSRAAVRHLGTVTKAIAKVSFKGLITGSKLAFVGMGAAAAGAAAKVGLISLAAKKATDDMAEYLRRLDTMSKQTGERVEDLAVIRYAAAMGGGDPDELLPTLGTIADQFGEIKKSIEDADAAYQKTNTWSKRGMLAAFSLGDADTAQNFLGEAVAARMSSLRGIEERKAAIDALIRQTGRGGQLYNSARRTGLNDAQTEAEMGRRRLQLVREFMELVAAEDAIRDGFGPAGEALEELKDVGLDMDRALKGGTETLYALADALEKIPDSSGKLRIAQQLFGEDAGAKNLALLSGGTAAIDRYRREMEAFGAVPTAEDAERGTSLKKSEGRRDMALQGVKLEVNRGLSPLMEETNDQLAGWLSRNRMTIATMVQETFVAVRTVFYDVLKFIEGNDDYESALFKKGAAFLEWSRNVIKTVTAIAEVTFMEVWKILNGFDSNWDWLNRVRDAFVWMKTLAMDVFAVFSGGNAETFEWLNAARDGVVDFMRHLREAWGMFKKVLDAIHAAIKPILNLFNTDVTTFALFAAMLSFSGILKGIGIAAAALIGAAGRLLPAFTTAFSGIATGVAAVIAKVGTIGAVAFGSLLAGWQVGSMIGKWAGDQIAKGHAEIDEKIAATMRARDKVFMANKYNSLEGNPDAQRTLQKAMGYTFYGTGKTESEQRELDIQAYNADPYKYGGSKWDLDKISDDDKAYEVRSKRQIEEHRAKTSGKVFNVNLSLGGKSATLYGEGDESFVAQLERANRM